MIHVLCPDCGSACLHPLTMPAECSNVRHAESLSLHAIPAPAMDPADCPDCKGTCKVTPPPPTDEQVRAAENRWTCPDRAFAMDGWRLCTGTGDVVVDDATWAQVKRAWRTRTKTTVIEHATWEDPDNTWEGLMSTDNKYLELDAKAVPDGCRGRGTWTVVVTFEPDDE